MKSKPWGHASRHCVYCGKVGPRVLVAGGWAHRRCVPKPASQTRRPKEFDVPPRQGQATVRRLTGGES